MRTWVSGAVAVAVAVGSVALAAPAGVSGATTKAAARTEAHHDLVPLSAMPKGWTVLRTSTTGPGATSPSATTTPLIDKVASCEGLPLSGLRGTLANAQVQYQDTSTVTFFVEYVTVFPDVRSAKAAFTMFGGPKALTCAGPALATAIASTTPTASTQLKATQVTVRALRVPRVGQQSAGLELLAPVASATDAEIEAQMTVVRSKKVFALLMPMGLDGHLATKLADSLVARAAARLK